MEREQAIQLIMKTYNVNINVASELYLIYKNRNRLHDLDILLHNVDLDKQRKK